MLYSCRKGCFADRPFDCIHGSRAKAVEPALKGGGNLYLEIYDPFVDHPKIVYQRHVREILDKNERNRKEGLAKAKRNQERWAEEVVQKSNDLQLCSVLPPPVSY